MDFDLTPEQESFRDEVRRFMKKEVIPLVQGPEKEKEFLWDVWRKMGKLGLLGMYIPENYGGAEADTVTSVLAIEEISRGHTALGFSVAPHNCFVGHTISQYGTEEQKKEISAWHCLWRAYRSWRLDRALCRFGCSRHQDNRY